MLLIKITPISLVFLLGSIYLIYQFFASGRDYNILPYIIIFIMILTAAFALDRFLLSKFDYIKLIIFELIFLVLSTIGYLYNTKITLINIETNKSYFFVVYDDYGLKKSDIPTKGLFDKSITINTDTTVHIYKSLEYDAQVNPPKAWNFSFTSKKLDAKIGSQHVIIGIYARNMNEKEVNLKLKEEIMRLQQ
ncbi:MAG: hypothetical protein EOO93_09400 [Pedobacter sp.]|nr:MAG: hypothetical protein EOO93_09400 [Pedobacter sp.]